MYSKVSIGVGNIALHYKSCNFFLIYKTEHIYVNGMPGK